MLIDLLQGGMWHCIALNPAGNRPHFLFRFWDTSDPLFRFWNTDAPFIDFTLSRFPSLYAVKSMVCSKFGTKLAANKNQAGSWITLRLGARYGLFVPVR